MKKITQYILMVAVAVAAYYGVRTLKQKTFNSEPTSTEITQQVDRWKAEAEREHPEMAKTDALKEVAIKETQKTLSDLSGSQRRKSAAEMFFGFYYMNTKLRVEYCKQRGVDITPYAAAFDQAHNEELIRAKEIYKNAGELPESVLPYIESSFISVIEQDMKDVAAGAEVPVESTCELFNDNAKAISEAIVLPPHVKKALMSAD